MPHAHESLVPLQVHVVTVSTSRGPAEDKSGPLLRTMVEGAGHIVVGHAIVPDDADAIGAELDRALGTANVELVLLTGGTGISARDCTPAVVRSRLTRELEGFGELFRSLSYAEIGPAAMLSSALGGLAGGRLVFVLPGSTGACRLGMDKLVLPMLGHLAGELRKEAPAARRATELVRPVVRARTTADPLPDVLAAPVGIEPPRRGMDLVQSGAGERPEPSSPPAAGGWQGALVDLGGRLVPVGNSTLPDALSSIPAAMDVLNSSTARMKLVCDDGRSWLVFGYPDLLRPTSKVLAVREALPVAEVVALHRWPVRVGLCCELEETLLPGTEASLEAVSTERCGRPWDGGGQLFAVDGAAVWVRERRYVRRWDGKRAGPEENVGPAIGSLLLHWSQR